MGFNEEYLLLIGGRNDTYDYSDKVHKYNGKWSFFGNLQRSRGLHNSVVLNRRVFIIGGLYSTDTTTATEIWDTSKPQFETESTLPELQGWFTYSNHAFIIPDYTSP